jgi:alpha-tubulin suppressor-like RCC1 family protein
MHRTCRQIEEVRTGQRRVGRRCLVLPATLATIVALLTFGVTALPAQGSAASPGQLYAFGGNAWGELGNSDVNREPNPTPTLVQLPGDLGVVTQAAAGAGFSLVVTSSGQLYSFGENEYGQLGDEANLGSSEANPTPMLVTLPGETGPVTQVAAGGFFSLAVTETGQLYSFGNNFLGELGNTTNYRTEEPNPTPTLVTLPGEEGPVTQVAAGGLFGLAATSTGQLYAFGSNILGQLGVSLSGHLSDPTPTLVALPEGAGPVTAIAAGSNFSLVATATDQLYAFGENDYGQLGNSNSQPPLEPHPTPTLVTLPGEQGHIAQIVTGGAHSLVLTSSGQLYAFGDNRFGQLGNANNDGTEAPNSTPTLVTLPGTRGHIMRIAAGDEYSLALTSAGQLYGFGSDYDGELGFPPGQHQERGDPHPTPTQVYVPGGNVESMATGSGSGQTLAMTADLTIDTSSLPVDEIGVAYDARAEGGGGATPDTWSASGLPPGLLIEPKSGAIYGTPNTAGAYTSTITLTDSDGIEDSRPLAITIKEPNEPPPPPPHETLVPPPQHETLVPAPPHELPPPPPHQTSPVPLPPSLHSARQSTRRWRDGNKLSHASRGKTPTGTTLSFSLNEQATVTFSFTQLLGRSKRAARSLSFTGHSGINRLLFTGWISHNVELRPGRYELLITAVNSAGQRSTPVSLNFTVVK